MKMQLWTRPSDYAGAEWPDYYVVVGQHRDSDRVTRSNFRVAKAELEAIEDKYPEWNEAKDEGRMLVNPCEGHWAVGHVEWLGVHKDAPAELLEAAEQIVSRIENYPLLDESDYSELEWAEANEYWDSLPIQWRLKDYVQPNGLPCFAARHDLSTLMHLYDCDRLWEQVTGE